MKNQTTPKRTGSRETPMFRSIKQMDTMMKYSQKSAAKREKAGYPHENHVTSNEHEPFEYRQMKRAMSEMRRKGIHSSGIGVGY